MNAAELEARLTLVATEGLGSWRGVLLIQRHGSGVAALRALPHEVGAPLAQRAVSPANRERVRRALAAIDTERLDVVAFDDARFPELFRLRAEHRHNLPPLLFARGDLRLLELPGVAVVGCRAATQYGLDVAEDLCSALARQRICVISGVARGIDGAAHAAALDAGGPTIGVLGCGVDVYYPHENAKLQDRIAQHGLLLSEQLPGEPPKRANFPRRNRIIAGLSLGVVVVEAGIRSGALSTAEAADEYEIDTYVVPGAMDRPNTQGILALVRGGCHLYTGPRDLMESLKLVQIGALPDEPAPDAVAAVAATPPPDEAQRRVWQGIPDHDAAHVDDVARAAGITTTAASVLLLEMELDGWVRQLPGNRFARVAAARPLARAT